MSFDYTSETTFGNVTVVMFVLVQALDGALTYMGVHSLGTSIEGNPLVGSVLAFAGVGGGLLLAKLVAVGLGMMLHLHRVHLIVALLVLFYVAVAIVPWTVLLLST